MSDLFNPTEEHEALRNLVRDFAERELAPTASAHDREERFDINAFRKLGKLGLLGLTIADHFSADSTLWKGVGFAIGAAACW